jgi:hypothetical protein
MAMLRQGPSGPPIVGNANNDVLLWNSVANEWNAGPVPASPGITEFDHLISSRADLVAVVAPVGGEFLLPTGSYFFKAQVVLGDGERVVVDGTRVLMFGGGAAIDLPSTPVPPSVREVRGIVGNYADNEPSVVVRNNGQLLAYNVVFGKASESRYGVAIESGNIRMNDCVIETGDSGTQPGFAQSGGAAQLYQTNFFEDGPCVVISGGATTEISRCSLEARDNGTPLSIATANSMRIVVHDCVLRGYETGRDVVYIDAPTSNIAIARSSIRGVPGEAAVVFVENAGAVELVGNSLSGTGDTRAGITVNTSVIYLHVTENIASYLSTFLFGASSVTAKAIIVSNNSVDATCPIGIDWSVADIPTSGMVEEGNVIDSAAPFSNHTAASARVMRRANVSLGTLLSDTAIVP